MFFEDLTPYAYTKFCDIENAVNVGWLSAEYPFEKGPTPRSLVWRLRFMAMNPTNAECFGFHECDLCNKCSPKSGTGEIHVVGEDGTTFCSARANRALHTNSQVLPASAIYQRCFGQVVSSARLGFLDSSGCLWPN